MGGAQLSINPGNSSRDAGDDVAGDGVSAAGQLAPRDIRSHDFGHIAGFHLVQMGNVYHNLVHGDATEHGAIGAVQVDAGSGVGEVVQVAVAKADADGGHAGGACGDVGVVVGDAVVAGQGANEGDSAVEGQGVLQFPVVGGRHG